MTDNINPEYQNTQDTPPAEQPVKKGNGLALLALIIGGIGTGIGIYNIEQLSKFGENFTLGQENPAIAQLEVTIQKQGQRLENFATTAQIDNLNQQVQTLAQAQQKTDIDKAQVEALIHDAVSAAETAPEKIAEIAKQHSITPEQVKSLVNQALADFAQGEHKIDLSQEIAAVQKSEAGAREVLNQIQAQAQGIESNADAAIAKIQTQANTVSDALAHKIQQLQESLNASAQVAANPYPLLNALRMAQFAAADNNYPAAKNYLDRAEESFALFGLNSAPYAHFRKAVTQLRTEYGILAGQPSPALRLDKLMTTIKKWPFKDVNPINLLAEKKANDTPKDWKDKIKGIGQNILENTVTVTPIDDAGLAWVNANEALQNLLRENVRLDLAFARNALQLHDNSEYITVVERLKTEIERYFDKNNDYVAAALDTLKQLKTQLEQTPAANISALIEQIEQVQNK